MHHIPIVLSVTFRAISLMFDASSVISEGKHRCDIVLRRSRLFGVKLIFLLLFLVCDLS